MSDMTESEIISLQRQNSRLRQSLILIAYEGCERFVPPHRCSDEPGRVKSSPFSAFQWCAPCIARAALEGDRAHD